MRATPILTMTYPSDGPTQAAHPDAMDFAAWYLGAVRCERMHGRQLFGIPFPCGPCLRWAKGVIADALAPVKKRKTTPKRKAAPRGKARSKSKGGKGTRSRKA